MKNGRVVLGAPNYDPEIDDLPGARGAAYVYEDVNGSFELVDMLVQPPGNEKIGLGFRVASNGDQIALGADVGAAQLGRACH